MPIPANDFLASSRIFFQRMVEDRRFLLAEPIQQVRIELAKRGIDLR